VAAVGRAFTAATGTFTEVPDNLRAKTEVKLTAEIYSQAAAAFGLGGFSTATVLDQTFNDVDLVGRPLSVGNFVNSTGLGAPVFSALTNTYTPYVALGDEAFADASHDETLTGQPYQEVLTNFPLGNQVLTGLFLNVTLSGPQGGAVTYDHTILDRVGYAARQGLAAPSLSVDPNGPPAVSDFDITTVNVLAGLQPASVSDPLYRQLAATQAQLQVPDNTPAGTPLPSAATQLGEQFSVGSTRLAGENVLSTSDAVTAQLGTLLQVKAYSDRPRVIITSSQVTPVPGTQTVTFTSAIDMVGDAIRALVFPGQASNAAFNFNVARGVLDNAVESAVGSQGSGTALTTLAVLQAAIQQGIPLAVLTSYDLAALGALNLPAEGAARITAALQAGHAVLVPVAPVTVNGQRTTAWYETDPVTGYTTGVMEDGAHQSLAQYQAAAAVGFYIGLVYAGLKAAFRLTGHEDWLHLTKDIAGGITKGGTGVGLGGKIIPNVKLGPAANLVLAVVSSFSITIYVIDKLVIKDPPVEPFLLDLNIPQPAPANVAHVTLATPGTAAGGAVAGGASVTDTSVSGQLSASWTSGASSGFQVQSLSASGATVTGPGGTAVGSGTVTLSVPNPVPVSVAGNVSYAVTGQGSLSAYGRAESGLGVSGNWDHYAATATGSVTITVTTDGLTLNGQALPARTYTITTSSATLAGAGPRTW
jgi:hypothetical protein